MPFQYSRYQSPFTSDIASLIARKGDIQARAAEQSGQGWANALFGIGQTVAQIPQQIQQQHAQQQDAQLRGLQIQGAQRQVADIDALDKAYNTGGLDRTAIINALPGHLRPTVQKQFTDADEAALKVQKLKDETNTAERDYFGSLAAGVQPFLTGEDHGLSAAMVALQHAKEKGYTDADRLWNEIKTNPQQLPAIVNRLMVTSPEQQKLANERLTAQSRAKQAQTGADRLTLETPKIEAETQHAVQQVEGTVPMTQAQKSEHDIQLANLGVAQGRLTEERRHNAATEAQSDAAPELTDDAKKLVAKQFAMTGQLPPMGMGKAGAKVRTDIINAAADEYKNLDLPSQIAAFKANQGSLTKLQQQRDAIGAFEQTATKNIDLFLAQAGKVVDTGSPLMNRPLRMITGQLLGSPDQAAFDAARQVAVNEIAKITTNPTLSGTLSDSARHEVEAFNPQSATLQQTVSVMRLLKQDMQNRTGALDEQIRAVQQRIATPPGHTPDASIGPRIGERRLINGQLGEWDGRGWKKVP